MAKKLTDISIAKFKPHPAKRREVPDAGKPGLYLVIQPTGKKSWAVRYRRLNDGRPRKLTLHGFPSLATAHKLAQAALDRAAEGGDPAAEKRAAKRTQEPDSFNDVAEEFLKRHVRPNTRPTYARDTERFLRKEVLPRWGNKRVQEITKRDVLDLLDGIVDRGGGLSANRVLAAIRKLFNWAIGRGILSTSPAEGVKPPLDERARDRILTDDELRLFWQACESIGYPFGSIAMLLLLTGQRRREVSGMSWSEIDLDTKTWTIPGDRTKNGEQHAVPLSDAVLKIIASLPRINSKQGFLFTTTGDASVSGFSRAKTAIDKAMKGLAPATTIERWTFHDLRRTAASGMARLGINLPVIEKVLNHTSGSFAGIVGVYQRHSFADEKRQALEAWANFIMSLQTQTQNVTRLDARRLKA
jgi:integrase